MSHAVTIELDVGTSSIELAAEAARLFIDGGHARVEEERADAVDAPSVRATVESIERGI